MRVLKASAVRDQMQRDGFVVVRSVISSFKLVSLRGAASAVAMSARAGKWPHVSTVGEQSPPWEKTTRGKGIWAVQHLMSPELPCNEVFTDFYFSEGPLRVARELLECPEDQLVMEMLSLLVRPETKFELGWHRNDIAATATAEEETLRVGHPAWHVQYNMALYEDESLVVVPGSHLRPRTDTERAAGQFEKSMPGQKVVHLNAGDIVFYDSNILHRSVYDELRQLMTLHGSVGQAGGSRERAQIIVLRHDVGSWVHRCNLSLLRDMERARAEGMRRRLIEMGAHTGDIGFPTRRGCRIQVAGLEHRGL